MIISFGALLFGGPIQDDLAGVAAHHSVKTFLEVGVMEAMGDDGGHIQTALHHVSHLVPVVHLTAVDALEGQIMFSASKTLM